MKLSSSAYLEKISAATPTAARSWHNTGRKDSFFATWLGISQDDNRFVLLIKIARDHFADILEEDEIAH